MRVVFADERVHRLDPALEAPARQRIEFEPLRQRASAAIRRRLPGGAPASGALPGRRRPVLAATGGITAATVAAPPPAARLEHDPEKWEPVFGQDHAQTKR